VVNSTYAWDALRHYPTLRFHVLVDNNHNVDDLRHALASYVEVDQVPSSFRPARARYKARVLENFRRKQEPTEDDWVLHLDEESEIDEYALRTCLDFIERGTENIGMVRLFISSMTWVSEMVLKRVLFR
jgi:hypothetical protein